MRMTLGEAHAPSREANKFDEHNAMSELPAHALISYALKTVR